MPVSLTAHALRAMMMYYLFRSFRISGGAQSGGGESPVERSSFFEYFYRAVF